jgi:lactoylglutathione lyase
VGAKYLHTMIRVSDLDQSIAFFGKLGLRETRRVNNEKARYTIVFVAAEGDEKTPIELTFNWDPEAYADGRNFGHLAFEVDDIYDLCARLMKDGITINRPPRDGHMAFIRTPDQISIELIQKDRSLPIKEPWASMGNTGAW